MRLCALADFGVAKPVDGPALALASVSASSEPTVASASFDEEEEGEDNTDDDDGQLRGEGGKEVKVAVEVAEEERATPSDAMRASDAMRRSSFGEISSTVPSGFSCRWMPTARKRSTHLDTQIYQSRKWKGRTEANSQFK